MPSKRLKEYLDKNKVKYISIQHSPAYTSPEIAAQSHIPGRILAKTVMVKIEGRMAMVVLPTNRKVILSEFKEALDAEKVTLASEDEFKEMFPDCEIGAMPPFGNLYGMDVYISPELTAEQEIVFNAGTHTELIKMAYKDFERLVQPKVIRFST